MAEAPAVWGHEFPHVTYPSGKVIKHAILEIQQRPLRFHWPPDGRLWPCQAVYFVDMRLPENQIPIQDHFDFAAEVVAELHGRMNEATRILCQYPEGNGANRWCMGAFYQFRYQGRMCSFSVRNRSKREDEGVGKRYLLLRIY